MNENVQKPSFFSQLPADVRYDPNLTDKAKLLYSEITAFTNMGGECYATDSYFATLYNSDKRTVQRWLSNLEKCGYIKREIVYKDDGKTISKRYIRVLNINVPTYGQKSHDPTDKNVYTPTDKNVVDSITSISTTRFSTKKEIKNDKEGLPIGQPPFHLHYLTDNLFKAKILRWTDLNIYEKVQDLNTLFWKLDTDYGYEEVLKVHRYVVAQVRKRKKQISDIVSYLTETYQNELSKSDDSYDFKENQAKLISEYLESTQKSI